MDASVKILKWFKHQRKDVKRPSWFALDNRLIEDEDFFDFNAEEFKVWIYLLSKASQRQSDEIEVNFRAGERICNIAEAPILSALEKLEKIKAVTATFTGTTRARHADVTPHYKTDITRQDKTTYIRPAT